MEALCSTCSNRGSDTHVCTLQLGLQTPGDNTPKQEGPREGEPPEPGESPACRGETLEGSMMTVGTKLRKMWLQSVRTLVLLNATSSSSMASRSSRSPSFWRYSKDASCQSGRGQPLRSGVQGSESQREGGIALPPKGVPGKTPEPHHWKQRAVQGRLVYTAPLLFSVFSAVLTPEGSYSLFQDIVNNSPMSPLFRQTNQSNQSTVHTPLLLIRLTLQATVLGPYITPGPGIRQLETAPMFRAC